jgi:hypothetical protein
MLTGIKTGKKKKRKETLKEPPQANLSVAEQLRQSLASGETKNNRKEAPKEPPQANLSVAEQLRQSLASGESLPVTTNWDNALERRGRISQTVAASTSNQQVVVTDFNPQNYDTNKEVGLTLSDMVAQEKSESRTSFAEQEMRNVLRLGKKRKLKSNMDSDEEEQAQLSHMQARDVKRDSSRQVALHDTQDKIIAKCWWWLESTSFSKHRLLALGNHVSLVMAPPNLSLFPGHHFYLVPIKHAESMCECEDEVWDEIRRFQSSLQRLYATQQKGLLYYETVLPTSGFWQTKLEAVAIPLEQWQDAPLYFKSALSEQAQEWGTHQKLIKTSVEKGGLRGAVPKKFSYFYLDYSTTNGFVQMIESRFPKDFGVDTIAGMMEMDPVRFRRSEKTDERKVILQFLDQWKDFDWTLSLDTLDTGS